MKVRAIMKRWLTLSISLAAVLAAAFRRRRSAQPDLRRAAERPPSCESNPVVLNNPSLKTFTGTVIRHGERFALLEVDGSLYLLDSVGRAWKFEGEEVWVRGQLDPEAGLLHVEDIESQAA
jgi:hypothetical protein